MTTSGEPIDFEERFLALASELGDVVHEGNVIEAEAELAAATQNPDFAMGSRVAWALGRLGGTITIANLTTRYMHGENLVPNGYGFGPLIAGGVLGAVVNMMRYAETHAADLPFDGYLGYGRPWGM